MIMSRSPDQFSELVRGNRGVVTLAQGEVRLTLCSSSLFVALQMVVDSSDSKSGSCRALFAYAPTPVPRKASGQAVQSLIAWEDVRDPLQAACTPLYGEVARAIKACVSQAALDLLHQVFAAVLGDIVAHRDAGNRRVTTSCLPPFNSSDSGKYRVPRIVVTPPDDVSSAAANAIPAPQNAAFGNQLTLPDPELMVINRCNPKDPFSDDFRVEEDHSDSVGTCDKQEAHPDDDSEGHDPRPDSMCLEEDDEEGTTALGLGPTWSG